MNDQIILDKFSERLFKLVKENNTDINMLARILGIKSKSTIYRYMNGEMSPKITTIKYLAEYFNVSLEFLVGVESEIEDIDYVVSLYRNCPDERKMLLINVMKTFQN